jgi:DnaK suppressor protein
MPTQVKCKGLYEMNKKKSAKFRKMLLAEKLVLEKQYRDLEEGNLHASQSEFSGEMPFEEEYAASGTTTFERERDLSLSENVKDILQRVNESLERIESGNFGICEMCGESIPEERLQALPYANLCITCKQKEEKAFR